MDGAEEEEENRVRPEVMVTIVIKRSSGGKTATAKRVRSEKKKIARSWVKKIWNTNRISDQLVQFNENRKGAGLIIPVISVRVQPFLELQVEVSCSEDINQ